MGPQWRLSASLGWHQGQTGREGGETDAHVWPKVCIQHESTWTPGSYLFTHLQSCMHWDTPEGGVWLYLLMQTVYYTLRKGLFIYFTNWLKAQSTEKGIVSAITCFKHVTGSSKNCHCSTQNSKDIEKVFVSLTLTATLWTPGQPAFT